MQVVQAIIIIMHHTYSETKSKPSPDAVLFAVLFAVLGTLVLSLSLGLLIGAICGRLCHGREHPEPIELRLQS